MNRTVIYALIAAIGVGAAALYGMQAMQGNDVGDIVANSCPADVETIKANLGELAVGDVAAFQTAREAQSLSALAFNDETGQPSSLADHSGRVLLVNLWATWCAPCRHEMPALDRLQADLGSGDGFSVVPINIDTGAAEKAEAFLQSVDVKNLPLYRDPTTDVFQDVKKRGFGIGLPVSILVDRKGCLLGHLAGPAEWDSEDAKALIRQAMAL
jgi:thiol-disulfide isomerase/thioredoxin